MIPVEQNHYQSLSEQMIDARGIEGLTIGWGAVPRGSHANLGTAGGEFA